jgi:hypothetical protein
MSIELPPSQEPFENILYNITRTFAMPTFKGR